ncbi:MULTISPECIES: hypothetical protein [unclassified Rathayibacter]|uniref:hypothetical protein n=1 Tax=unclassified Rathayibacter TaxID=2609250 RepID=UPI00188D642D|nr:MULTISPECIES: hypothetical protein [unclassified Rathayibacter]MBF4461023.1 hypothetical protein [Rathayibacter sp. VKM Ac-2879]MBF4502434.1 hypothetical protein [Rathayibacter sp. VKM Ac-2878]
MTVLSRVRTIGKALLGAVVALAGAITAVAAALFIVAPQLAPREKLGAELDRIAIAQGVHYGEYEGVQGIVPAADEEKSNPPERGLVVIVHAKLYGFEDRSYSLAVTAYDATTHIRVPLPMTEGDFSATCDNKSPAADEDGVAWRCWLIAPPRGVEYFLRAELLDSGPTQELKPGPVKGSRELLDFIDSEVLTSAGPDS